MTRLTKACYTLGRYEGALIFFMQIHEKKKVERGEDDHQTLSTMDYI